MEKTDTNPYYRYLESDFARYYERKNEMEKDFHPDMIQEFTELKSKLVSTVVDLLKLGAEYEMDENSINIYVNNDVYNLSIDVLKETMGETQFRLLFDKSYKADNMAPNYDYRNDQNIVNSIPTQNNPMAAMLGPFYSFMQGFGNTMDQKYKEYSYPVEEKSAKEDNASSILKEIANVQKKVILLEQEKNNSQKECDTFRERFDSSNEKLKNLEAEYNTQKNLYDELLIQHKTLEEEKETLSQDIKTLNETISALNSEVANKDTVINDCQDSLAVVEKDYNDIKISTAATHDEDVRTIAVLQTNLDNVKRENESLTNKVNTIDSLKDRVNELVNEKNNLDNQISSLQNAISLKDSNIAELKEEIDKLKMDIHNQAATLNAKNSESDSYKSELAELTKKYNEQSELLELTNSELENVSKEFSDYKVSTSNELEEVKASLTKEMEDIKNASASEVEELKTDSITKLEELRTSLDNEKNEAITKEREAAQQKIAEIEKLKSGTDEQARKIQSLTDQLASSNGEKDRLIKEISKINDDNKKLKLDIKDNETSIERLNDEIEKLTKLAYYDNKTKAKNSNAFNTEFAEKDKNRVALSIIGIRNMKKINEEHGRDSGDKVIAITADKIIENFPNSTVYRLLGDQFAVVTENKNLNQIRGQLVDTQRAIKFEQIDIYYGVAIGINCDSHNDIIRTAEDESLKMKRELDSEDGNADNYAKLKQSVSPNIVNNNTTNKESMEIITEDIFKYINDSN